MSGIPMLISPPYQSVWAGVCCSNHPIPHLSDLWQQSFFLAHTVIVGRQRALLISHSGSQTDGADTLSNTASHGDSRRENCGGFSSCKKVFTFKPKSSSQLDTHPCHPSGIGSMILPYVWDIENRNIWQTAIMASTPSLHMALLVSITNQFYLTTIYFLRTNHFWY